MIEIFPIGLYFILFSLIGMLIALSLAIYQELRDSRLARKKWEAENKKIREEAIAKGEPIPPETRLNY